MQSEPPAADGERGGELPGVQLLHGGLQGAGGAGGGDGGPVQDHGRPPPGPGHRDDQAEHQQGPLADIQAGDHARGGAHHGPRGPRLKEYPEI